MSFRPVNVVEFTQDRKRIISVSDDKTVRVWDLLTQEEEKIFEDHTDYVKALALCSEAPNIIATGSYDHTVRIYDIESKECILTLDHGEPVESVLFFRGGNLIAVAGGPYVKIYDIKMNGKCVGVLGNHEKTVTCMAFDGKFSRLLVGTLDQHVKVYELQDYKLVCSMNYPAPILSMGISQDDRVLVVGMSTGLLSIKKQKPVGSQELKVHERITRSGTYQYFIRGTTNKGEKTDIKATTAKKQKLKPYDKYLKAFQYGKALDEAFKHKGYDVLLPVLEELVYRNGLKAALTGKDERTVKKLIDFAAKNLNTPNYTNLAIEVANTLLDVCIPTSAYYENLFEHLHSLQLAVNNELIEQRKLYEVLGLIDSLVLSSDLLSDRSMMQ
ncbi:U3 small nucleolar RNA-associated protein 15-like protein [Zancudomyces culisetae]|uniref:U3 small nucleolar RNA-associated protein 15-like protein n=1 Tax=Zancudomyces culisetae TaxID=1213189 RepID=A0A1R1PXY0_ZANCU|nr:U3 small nucleolar RNA-associated protein 15-like protein [Zancudomyces culisetae]|eukprot:OMH85767.1 U3 small nucleolar RNA-associated protein 15-like protein [Zancudomyces culisetae]